MAWGTAWLRIGKPLPRVNSQALSQLFLVVLPVPMCGVPAFVIFSYTSSSDLKVNPVSVAMRRVSGRRGP
jgi:hypothetical protein